MLWLPEITGFGEVLTAQPAGFHPGGSCPWGRCGDLPIPVADAPTPKGATALHRNLVANAFQFRHWLVGLAVGRRQACWPFQQNSRLWHASGMAVKILLGRRWSSSPIRATPPDLLNIVKYRATFFPGVPTMYAIINQNPGGAGRIV